VLTGGLCGHSAEKNGMVHLHRCWSTDPQILEVWPDARKIVPIYCRRSGTPDRDDNNRITNKDYLSRRKLCEPNEESCKGASGRQRFPSELLDACLDKFLDLVPDIR
jgi:hypothetical protein